MNTKLIESIHESFIETADNHPMDIVNDCWNENGKHKAVFIIGIKFFIIGDNMNEIKTLGQKHMQSGFYIWKDFQKSWIALHKSRALG